MVWKWLKRKLSWHPAAVDLQYSPLATTSEVLEAVRLLGESADERAAISILSWLRRFVGREYERPDQSYVLTDFEKSFVFQALINLGPFAVDPLVAVLFEQPNWESWGHIFRDYCARVLARIRDPRVKPALLEAIQRGDERLRNEVLPLLGGTKDSKFIELLLHYSRVAGSEDASIVALGNFIDNQRVMKRLQEARKEKGRSESVANAFANSGNPLAYEPLVSFLRHSDVCTRRAAIRGLGNLRDRRAIVPLLDRLDSLLRNVVVVNLFEFELIVTALGEFRSNRAVSRLERYLLTRSSKVGYDERVAMKTVAIALGTIGSREAAAALERAIAHRDFEIHSCALSGIRHLTTTFGVQLLARQLKSECEVTREIAAIGIAKATKKFDVAKLISDEQLRLLSDLLNRWLSVYQSDSSVLQSVKDALERLGNLPESSR